MFGGVSLWKTYQTLTLCQNFRTGLPLCQNCPTGQRTNPGKYYKEIQPPVSTTVPSGTNTIIVALVYSGIHLDLRFRPKQSHTVMGLGFPGDYKQSVVSNGRPHLHGALLPWRLQAVCCLQWASSPSTLDKRRLDSLFMITF